MTTAAVVTVFADGQGTSQGVPQTTVAATEGVNDVAGELIFPFAQADGGLLRASTLAAAPSLITPAPDGSGVAGVDPSCNQCSIYFQYVSVYYWPTPNSNNSACLSGVTEEVNGPVPTDLVP